MVLQTIKNIIPSPLMEALRRRKRKRQLQRIKALPAITEEQFLDLLTATLGVKVGSLVMIHSSIGDLNLAFSPMRVVPLLKQAVGDDGTLLFLCTTKADKEMDYLDGTHIFNRKRTPTGAGLISELARRTSGAARSLHPTKSVCAIGPLAEELTSGHEDSPYPFDKTSPYGKFVERDGLVIGLGVTAFNLSIAHCVEDFMKEEFPVSKYLGEYDAKCIDSDGSIKKVRTLASNPAIWAGKTVMPFFDTHIDESILHHHIVSGQNFFSCHAAPLIERMTSLAKEGKTIYPAQENKESQA